MQLHLVKRPGQDDYDYKYLYLDVKGMDEHCYIPAVSTAVAAIQQANQGSGPLGQHRVYLENSDDKPTTPRREKRGLFGVRWG